MKTEKLIVTICCAMILGGLAIFAFAGDDADISTRDVLEAYSGKEWVEIDDANDPNRVTFAWDDAMLTFDTPPRYECPKHGELGAYANVVFSQPDRSDKTYCSECVVECVVELLDAHGACQVAKIITKQKP